MRRLRRLRFVGGLLLGALTLASCSMVNPYISHSRKALTEDLDDRKVEKTDLEKAISYTNEVKASYRKALGREATFSNVLGALLVPTGAMALTMGVAGVHSNTILMTGGSGTALFGVGKWLESKPRQAAYVAGYNAVNCAIEAVLPFRFSEKQRKRFTASMGRVDTNIVKVQKNIAKVEEAKNNLSRQANATDAQLISEAEKAITSAGSDVARALDARNKGFVVKTQRARAGNALVTAVDAIIGQVDAAIQKSQPDLKALSAIISGLSQTYAQFTTVPDHLLRPTEPKVDKTTKAVSFSDLNTSVTALKASVAELLEDERAILDVVNLLTAENSLAALKKCGVEPAKIIADIILNPAGDVTFPAQGGQAARSILGGKRPFGFVVTPSIAGLHVSQPFVFGRAIAIRAEEDLQTGTYTVHVVDGDGRTAHFNIVVE